MRGLEFVYMLDMFISHGCAGMKLLVLQPIFDCALRDKHSMSAQAITDLSQTVYDYM